MLKIRAGNENDLPAIVSIYNHAVIHTTATFDLEPQTLAQRKQWFDQYKDRYPFLVAEQNGEVLGYVSLSPFRIKPAYNLTAELSIYVSPHAKGKGIGSLLMKAMIQKASECGLHVLISSITGDNQVSMKLHEKFGFRQVGTLTEVGFKFNRWIDIHFYQLILPNHQFKYEEKKS